MTPFGALPVLELDGQVVAQSNAINRYVGRLTDLYPSDPWQAALCDEAMEAVEDITTKIVATRDLPEEQKKTQRKALVDGPIPFYLTRLQQRLEAHGGRYFAADQLSVADLKVSEFTRNLRSGALDHVPTDLPERVAPKLVEHYERVRTTRASRPTMPILVLLADGASIHIRSGVSGFFRTCVEKKDMSTFATSGADGVNRQFTVGHSRQKA